MNTHRLSQSAPYVAVAPIRSHAPPSPASVAREELDRFERKHPADAFQESAARAIDKTFNIIGLSLSVTGCALVGCLAGSLLGPVAMAVGAAGGALSGGVAYTHGYGGVLGKGAMAASSVATGALLGSLGGPTGAVIGASLGAAYAGLGLYFSRD